MLILQGKFGLFNVDYFYIYQISSEIVNIDKLIFAPIKNRKHVFNSIIEPLLLIYPEGFPLIHPISDMKIKDASLPKIISEICDLENL